MVNKLQEQKMKKKKNHLVDLYAMSYLISLARKSSKKKAYCAVPAHLPKRSTASALG